MCGIVGLYLKSSLLYGRLGEFFAPMLMCMSGRGPDSAGFALYGDESPSGYLKVTLRDNEGGNDWSYLRDRLAERFACDVAVSVNANYAVLQVKADDAELRRAIVELAPELRIMSIGRRIEILKEVGRPSDIVDRFDVARMTGTHIIGHTRMATESAVTTDGSHPFSTGRDLCLVHNGSLSNHNRLRDRLRRSGIAFHTENDSEVAAAYVMFRLQQGDSLQLALESSLRDLDGFYTFAIGTADGFAVLRDPIACKPAVMAENDAYVAIASEYQALALLPGVSDAKVWEPKPAVVYTWGGAEDGQGHSSR